MFRHKYNKPFSCEIRVPNESYSVNEIKLALISLLYIASLKEDVFPKDMKVRFGDPNLSPTDATRCAWFGCYTHLDGDDRRVGVMVE